MVLHGGSRLDGGVQRDVGGGRGAADAGVRQLRRARCRGQRDLRVSRQRAVPAGLCGDPAMRRAIALTPGLLHAVDAVQRLGWVGPARPARQQRPPVLRRDGGQEQLWRMAAGEAPRLYTADDGWVPHADLGDGDRELRPDRRRVPGGVPDEPGRQQAADAGRPAPARRPTATSPSSAASIAHAPVPGGDPLPSTAWHPEFQDVNNDGFIDLFVSKGNVERSSPTTPRGIRATCSWVRPTARSRSGAEQAGIVDFERGRGAALADLNLDGLLDLVAGRPRRTRPAVAQRRVAAQTATGVAMGHWLGTGGCARPAPNRDAIGAWIEVRVGDALQRRELTVGGGHVGGQLGWTHFGLGPASRAEVRVTWPDGEVGPWIGVDADQFAIIDRGSDRSNLGCHDDRRSAQETGGTRRPPLRRGAARLRPTDRQPGARSGDLR